jgi:KDO2-lipid IV(A) lauroyltransferase
MVFGESKLKDLYRRVVWGPYRQLLEAAPPAWEYRANRRLGQLVAQFAAGKRKDVVENLRRAFPVRQDLDAIAVEAFATHFLNQYASFAFAKITPENWNSYLRIEGMEHLEAARAAGQGVVLLHPHMGPAQLPLCVLGVLGWPVHQIGGGETAMEKSATGRWASAERARLEARMPVKLQDGSGYLRVVLRALQAGEVVLTACDGTGGGQELGRRYERSVLGQRMRLPVGGFYLAKRAGARLHPLVTVRDPQDARRHLSVIGPQILLGSGDVKQVLEDGADCTARLLEDLLRRHPGQWLFWDAFRPGELLC